MRAMRRIYVEKEKRLSTSYLRLLIIVDFLTILVSGSYAPVVLMPRVNLEEPGQGGQPT